MKIFILLVLCLTVFSTWSIPVQTDNTKKAETENPSPSQTVQLLQKKLVDLQTNLQRLGVTIDAAEHSETDYETVDPVAEQLAHAMGFRLSKYDEVETNSEQTGSHDPPPIDTTETKTVHISDDKVIQETVVAEEEIGLTSDEAHLFEMLKEKVSGKRRGNVLRSFLEESIGQHQEKTDDDNERNVKEAAELSDEIEDLKASDLSEAAPSNDNPSQSAIPDIEAEVSLAEEKPHSDTEVGPVHAQLEDVESKILHELKEASERGISLNDLIDDVTAKEKAALEKETYELAEQLSATRRELEKMQRTSN
uniref:Myosin-3-like n=1 Tax=Saccoglossus kowalevskii TaxID=10224 RepID=A0ABM0MJZ0_SACKO|nr:PREDICTED: myosin-3-like [Saccoglossus kowalevskii]